MEKNAGFRNLDRCVVYCNEEVAKCNLRMISKMQVEKTNMMHNATKVFYSSVFYLFCFWHKACL